MTERRVVITGVGTVNALGVGSDSYFEAMLAGAIGVKRIAHFDPSGFPSQIGGESDEFKMNSLVPKAHRKATKLMSRDIELAVLAADYAVRDAGLTTKGTDPESDADIDPTRSGVNIGAGLISCDPLELGAATAHAVVDGNFDLPKWGREGMQSLTPLWLLKYLPNMLNCHISIIHDLQGPNNSLTCGEAAGVLAVGEAFRNIQHGKADMIIAGGAECKTNPMGLVRQCLMKRTSTGYNDRPAQASRPFDQDADGTVLGEGGGIMILEELEHARSRGARIYCELVGFGASSQFGPDLITPEPDGRGMTIAMNKALAESGLTAEAIDLLVPHGTGYPRGRSCRSGRDKNGFWPSRQPSVRLGDQESVWQLRCRRRGDRLGDGGIGDGAR